MRVEPSLGLLLFLLTSTTIITGKKTEENDTLKLVILIHRHGDRTPIKPYPRDPYNNASYWPDGWGELTIKGKQRMYNLGVYLAKRYRGFLGSSPLETYIRSSGSDRCLQSVSLVMAGLYPPESRWKWNKDLGNVWQPFPIQTVPHDYDGMLNPESFCKKGKQEIERIYNSPVVQEYANQMKATLQYVKDNSGSEQMDLIVAEEVFDTLLIENEYNMKLPAWVDPYAYQQLADIMAKTFVFSGMTREIQRLRTGLLLKDILEKLSTANYGDKRLYVYSTHDTQLSVLLSALNVFNGLSPPFGSAVMLEIHQNQTQEPYIKTLYLNVTESESPYELELHNCGPASNGRQTCAVTNFHQMVSDLIPDNWEEECENTTAINTDAISVYILAITLFITVCALLVFVYLFLNNRRHAMYYRALPVN